MAVPTKLISTSVGFQDAKGNLVALGFLRLAPSGPAEVIASGGQITTQPLFLPLDANAKITATAIWFSDELNPAVNYSVQLYGSNGLLLINDFGYVTISGASFDLSLMVPTTQGSAGSAGVVLLNPGNVTQTISTGNLAITNNETVGGTLGVTGAVAFSSTLGVTGTSTLGTTNTTGGVLNGSIGATTPNAGSFTTINASGNSTLANVTLGGANTLTVANIKQVALTSFVIADPLAAAHFFISNVSPYTNTFVGGNGAGVVFLGSANKTSVDDVTGNVTLSGSTSGTTILKASAIASGTLTFPAANGTLAVIPTVTLKNGTGAGNYTTSSTTFVRPDSTNLAFTVTIPTGWKLLIAAAGSVSSATAVGGVNVALADGSADNTGILIQAVITPNISGAATFIPFSLNWVVNGDGASHTINLQFSTGNAADAATLVNNTSTLKPMMTFLLTPSN